MDASVWLAFIFGLGIIIIDIVLLFIYLKKHFKEDSEYKPKKGFFVFPILTLDIIFALIMTLFVIFKRDFSNAKTIAIIPFLLVALLSIWKILGYTSTEKDPSFEFKRLIGVYGAVSLALVVVSYSILTLGIY